jgi:AraC-like DNA-binding protein
MIQKEKLISKHLQSGVLYESGFCEIKNWTYDLPGRGMARGFNDCLCILYVYQGEFLFDISRQSYTMHSGYVVIDKPGYEYGLHPASGSCTIFNFASSFYERYLDEYQLRGIFLFSNENFCSVMMRSTAEVDYLHYQLLRQLPHAGRLAIDQLALELFGQVVAIATNRDTVVEESELPGGNQLGAVERAKDYLNEHFREDISLQDLSTYSCVSPFHFLRLFKRMTAYTPHQYLLQLRLKHGEILLKNGPAPVTEVAYECGFSSVEYFGTAFKNKYGWSPSQFRKMHRG